MAYEAELMPFDKANKFANEFCSLFSEQAFFLSNSSWKTNRNYDISDNSKLNFESWTPLTEATFDSGIIVCDIDKVGIAWFEDED